MEILELKNNMTEIRILMDGFDNRHSWRELVNKHKFKENIQNNAERDKTENTEEKLRHRRYSKI